MWLIFSNGCPILSVSFYKDKNMNNKDGKGARNEKNYLRNSRNFCPPFNFSPGNIGNDEKRTLAERKRKIAPVDLYLPAGQLQFKPVR